MTYKNNFKLLWPLIVCYRKICDLKEENFPDAKERKRFDQQECGKQIRVACHHDTDTSDNKD